MTSTYRRYGARIAYLAVVALATLTRLDFELVPMYDLQDRVARALSLDVTARDVVDGLRNLLLFAGWGLVWCITAPTGRQQRAVIAATISGMVISMCVESAQLFSPRRQASILDVLTNSSGALLGAVVAVVLLRATLAARGARSFVGMPMLVFAATYGAAALLEVLLPGVRQDLLAGAEGGPLARFGVAFSRIGWGRAPIGSFVLQALLMVPAGAFAVAALVERGRPYGRALLLCAAGGACLILLLEFARGLTGQPIELGMFTAHALGLLCGAGLTATWLPAFTRTFRGRARPLALAAAYVVVLLLWRWQPFVPHLELTAIRQSLTASHLMPLQGVTMKMDLFSASVVAIGFLLHVPLGALLAVWPLRLRGWLAHMLPGFWVVALVEAGQILIRGRYFDTTDIILGATGVLAGWALLRKAGFRPHGEALP